MGHTVAHDQRRGRWYVLNPAGRRIGWTRSESKARRAVSILNRAQGGQELTYGTGGRFRRRMLRARRPRKPAAIAAQHTEI